jgi:type I restriction enzyme S subunit
MARYVYYYLGACKDSVLVPLMQGTANMSMKVADVAGVELPLPPLGEQRLIVARLDALAEKTREVEAHLDAAELDSLRLLVTLATKRNLSDEQRLALGWRPGTIADIAALALDPVPVEADRSYPNVGILSYAKGLFGKVPIDGATTSAKTLYRIASGQFIYSRLFAFEGAYALVSDEFDGCYVSNEFPTFEVNRDLASSKFLMTLFMAEADWQEMRASTTGVGDRRLRIQPEHILSRQIWIPPLRELRRIDSMFDQHFALKARLAAIRRANAALLPATLDRLFAGSA